MTTDTYVKSIIGNRYLRSMRQRHNLVVPGAHDLSDKESFVDPNSLSKANAHSELVKQGDALMFFKPA